MVTLDIDSLFTNISLEETIDICTNTLLGNAERVEGLVKIELKKLLTLLTIKSIKYFIFNVKFYKQVDGVTMGSPLGPTLASVFLVCCEKNGL